MRRFLATLIVFSFACVLQAQKDSVYYGNSTPTEKQQKKKKDNLWKEKLVYGGDLQLLFGTYTFIYLSPTIGYSPAKRLYAAVGPVYNYVSDGRYVPRFSQSIFGAHSVARFQVIPALSLVGQFDILQQPDYFSSIPDQKAWVNYALGGLGYTQPLGEKTALYTSLLYNFTPNRLSIYPSNFILQIGFSGRF